jgi:dipeptidyl aminopeptidase/acylaminoacyl peptidase
MVAKEAPERFRAAVAQRGVYDLTIWWGSANTWRLFEGEFGGRPWEQPELARAQSPLTYVANVRTPLLLLQGEADLRCMPEDNVQLFTALRVLRRTVEYVLYPEESHVYFTAGRPDRRIDRMTRMLDWFDRFLKG